MKVYIHPTCSTCKKGLKWLDQVNKDYEVVDIRQTPPSKALFLRLLEQGTPPSKLFNTSGELYRELGLKDKMSELSNDEKATLLSENGMLVKRPVFVEDDKVSFGANEKVLKDVWCDKV